MKRAISITAALAIFLAVIPQVSMADQHGHGGWHGGGGYAAWWILPPLILLATLPAYNRYPPYDPPVVVQQPMPPAFVVQQVPLAPPAPPVQATASPTAQYYYCESARGFYPYVASCPSGWKQVPATPPDSPQ
jgi:hypothetical protein